MGANIAFSGFSVKNGEPFADIEVKSSSLKSVKLGGAAIADIIDELPILAVAACFAEGVTEITGAGELRLKESDRLSTVSAGLRALGADVTETGDGMLIRGGSGLRGAVVDAAGDHRVEMAFAVAGALASGRTKIVNGGAVGVSFPGFYELLSGNGIKIQVSRETFYVK
jgi:3-phosphoshikimate 1-carboxyvinyltransferase